VLLRSIGEGKNRKEEKKTSQSTDIRLYLPPMVETQDALTQELRSFVTFALALKPALTMHRKADTGGPNLTLTISASDQPGEAEIASLEPLMARYKPLKSYLDAILNSNESVATCQPTSNFEPNVHYRLVRISGEQYRIAKEVATRLDRIHGAQEAKDSAVAKKEYDSFHEYLGQQRAALVGEFKGIQLTKAVASYGVGRGAVYDDDCSGLVIFVVIEIFIG
jgi:hypothetical protein